MNSPWILSTTSSLKAVLIPTENSKSIPVFPIVLDGTKTSLVEYFEPPFVTVTVDIDPEFTVISAINPLPFPDTELKVTLE